MFADHCDVFNSGVEQSLSVVRNKKYQPLLGFISSKKNKISRVDFEAQEMWHRNFSRDGRRS
jgi:CRISPR/Cas system CMR-associated protein Cmr5 small subunit